MSGAVRTVRTRSSRRRGRQSAQNLPAFQQKPFRQPRLQYEPTKAVSDDQLEAIHNTSLQVLQEIGIDVIHEEAKAHYKKAGADVVAGSDRVRFPIGLIDEAIRTCPSSFTLHARNPAHNIHVGDNHLFFSSVASAPNCSDLDNGRRVGNHEDFQKFLKLSQSCNIIHINGGYPVEPVDIHASIRHLTCLSDTVKLTDKAFHIYSLGKERNQDGLEITRIARGISNEQLDREVSCMTIINSSSPLRLDTPMMQGIMEMSSRNQLVVMTPFTLAGAMAPVTIAGALVEQNAEALAGIALTQLVRPGAPVIYGGFTSNVDMKSGAPAFGTPEYMKAALVGGQLARRYGLPYRTSNACAANFPDAQAAWESSFSLWGAIMGGGNLVKHAAGWMEGGLTASFEKFIMDVDCLQMMAEFLDPLIVDDDTMALEAIRDVGPGGHFFGTQHTQDRYKDAFYAPIVSDWRNYESWEEAGSPTAEQKANKVFKQVLADYERPPLDPAIEEELDAFVAKRIEEGGVPTDF
ncbi:MAG: methyltransferase [Hyphomicrobiales bacterium]|nr:MAG: methyltransferase [Hyphomicrobiales bacterium]